MVDLPFQDLKQHPCWRSTISPPRLSHRSGGFGGTCERCGTALVEGDVNKGTEGPLKWEPAAEPKPFQPGSAERMIYDTLKESGAPIHDEWKRVLSETIADALKKREEA